MPSKDEYIAKLETTLHEISAKIDELKVQATLGKAEASDELDRRISTLREQKAEADKKMEELRDSGEEIWQELRVGMEDTLNNLKDGVRKALEKFK